MKITVKHYDEELSIETKHDDVTFDEFMELVRRVSHAVGYSHVTINEWYKE